MNCNHTLILFSFVTWRLHFTLHILPFSLLTTSLPFHYSFIFFISSVLTHYQPTGKSYTFLPGQCLDIRNTVALDYLKITTTTGSLFRYNCTLENWLVCTFENFSYTSIKSKYFTSETKRVEHSLLHFR